MYSSGPARSDLVLVICGPWHPCGRVGRHTRPCFDDDSTFACQPKIDPILAPHKTCLRSVHVFCHRLRDEHISFAYCAVACDAELHRHHDPHGTHACDSAAAACLEPARALCTSSADRRGHRRSCRAVAVFTSTYRPHTQQLIFPFCSSVHISPSVRGYSRPE